MEDDLKAYRRPGKAQTASVIFFCLLLMVVATYIGFMLLAEKPMDSTVQRIVEEVRSHFD